MAALAPLPPLPPQFKSIQHHLRTAQEHDKRDPVVAYYCECFRVVVAPLVSSSVPSTSPKGAPNTSGILAGPDL